MPRVRRGFLSHLGLFFRLIWPGLAFILLVNAPADYFGAPRPPLWLTEVLAIVAMLAAAWLRDRRVARARPRLPEPFGFVDDDAGPHADMARAVVVEYLAGDLDVDELDAQLDYFLRSVARPRPTAGG